MSKKLFAVIGILALVLALLPGVATAAPVGSSGDDPQLAPKEDNRPDPLTAKQSKLKEQALEAKLRVITSDDHVVHVKEKSPTMRWHVDNLSNSNAKVRAPYGP